MPKTIDRPELSSVIGAVRLRETELRRLGVTALYFYGSQARGDYHPDSDLDVLVDYNRECFSLFDLVGVQHIIGDDTGLEVHAATRDSYGPDNFKRLQPDLIRIF